MKPITEENRKQLISLARIEISRWKIPGDKQYMVDLMEIALASLTAEPIGVVNRESTSDNNEFLDAKVECVHPQAGWENFQDGFILYTAPSVPVIKLPRFLSNSNHNSLDYTSGKFDGFIECIAELKRLNGLG